MQLNAMMKLRNAQQLCYTRFFKVHDSVRPSNLEPDGENAMDTTLLNLPWQVQLTLASGYAAYLMANSGNRTHHQPVDVAFSTLLFGMFGTVVYNGLVGNGDLGRQLLVGVVAFAATVAMGALWRKWGRAAAAVVMAKSGISISNDDPSALASMFADASVDVSQISVKTDDGRWLHCDDTRLFADSPNGPCIVGPTGDVALYITHIHSADGCLKTVENRCDPAHGDMMTYVPASQVTQINFRFKTRS